MSSISAWRSSSRLARYSEDSLVRLVCRYVPSTIVFTIWPALQAAFSLVVEHRAIRRLLHDWSAPQSSEPASPPALSRFRGIIAPYAKQRSHRPMERVGSLL